MGRAPWTIADGIPDDAPFKRHTVGITDPFKVQWTAISRLLERELQKAGAKDAVLHLELRGPQDLNREGGLRADARPKRAVLLRFRDGKGHLVQLGGDRYGWWQANVYAIAKTLEMLRAMERYGISNGRQFVGFRQLPGAGGTSESPPRDRKWAINLVAREAGTAPELIGAIGEDREYAALAIRRAKAKAHPDAGGDPQRFADVTEAAKILSG